MNWRVVVAACAVIASRTEVRADDTDRPTAIVERAREHFRRGELAEARRLLLDAYRRGSDPGLLFALGQVELRLGHPRAAIIYYERFLASHPQGEEAALAQQ